MNYERDSDDEDHSDNDDEEENNDDDEDMDEKQSNSNSNDRVPATGDADLQPATTTNPDQTIVTSDLLTVTPVCIILIVVSSHDRFILLFLVQVR